MYACAVLNAVQITRYLSVSTHAVPEYCLHRPLPVCHHACFGFLNTVQITRYLSASTHTCICTPLATPLAFSDSCPLPSVSVSRNSCWRCAKSCAAACFSCVHSTVPPGCSVVMWVLPRCFFLCCHTAHCTVSKRQPTASHPRLS